MNEGYSELDLCRSYSRCKHPKCQSNSQEAKFLAEAKEIRDGDIERGWPGDGSGTDDLADYNANEADDYRDE